MPDIQVSLMYFPEEIQQSLQLNNILAINMMVSATQLLPGENQVFGG